MKLLLTFLYTIIFSIGYGKDKNPTKLGLYFWDRPILMQPCKLDGTKLKDAGGTDLPAIPSKLDQEFYVLTLIENDATAIIQVLDYTDAAGNGANKMYVETPEFYKYNFNGTPAQYAGLTVQQADGRNYGSYQIYFKVSASFLDDHATKESYIKGSLAAGVINFPFKYRPQKGKGDFSGAFNFGAGIGYTFKHQSWRQCTFSVITGYSISNIVLDSSNTTTNQGKLTSINNLTAFSFSFGVLAEYQRIQAGLFLGWDRLGRLNQKEFGWQYQGKPWISIAFGIGIFGGQKEQDAKSKSAQSN